MTHIVTNAVNVIAQYMRMVFSFAFKFSKSFQFYIGSVSAVIFSAEFLFRNSATISD